MRKGIIKEAKRCVKAKQKKNKSPIKKKVLNIVQPVKKIDHRLLMRSEALESEIVLALQNRKKTIHKSSSVKSFGIMNEHIDVVSNNKSTLVKSQSLKNISQSKSKQSSVSNSTKKMNRMFATKNNIRKIVRKNSNSPVSLNSSAIEKEIMAPERNNEDIIISNINQDEYFKQSKNNCDIQNEDIQKKNNGNNSINESAQDNMSQCEIRKEIEENPKYISESIIPRNNENISDIEYADSLKENHPRNSFQIVNESITNTTSTKQITIKLKSPSNMSLTKASNNIRTNDYISCNDISSQFLSITSPIDMKKEIKPKINCFAVDDLKMAKEYISINPIKKSNKDMKYSMNHIKVSVIPLDGKYNMSNISFLSSLPRVSERVRALQMMYEYINQYK